MSERTIVSEAGGRQDVSRRRLLKGTAAIAGMTVAGVALQPRRDVSAQEGEHQTAALPWHRSPASMVEVERGVRVHVQDWGSGKPIILLHGWPSSHQIFERQMLELAQQGYRAIGIDLRGFGQSDKPWHGNDYDTWAEDIGAVINTLGLRDVTLVGYSMGGAIAARYLATHRRSQVTKLVLLGAAAPSLVYSDDNPHGLPAEAFEAMLQGILSDRAGFFHNFMPSLFHSSPSPAYISRFEAIVTSASLQATVRGLEEGRGRDVREDLASIEIPTTIMHGIHDQVVPFPLAEEQHRLIEGSTLVPFEQSGHAPFVDEAEKLTIELMNVASS